MLIELECVLAQVLPESGDAGAPFSLKEIADVAARYSDEPITYSRVHRAWSNLYDAPATRELVAPLDVEARHIELSAAGARRVLRRLWKGRIPRKIEKRNPFTPIERASAALPTQRKKLDFGPLN